MAGNGTARAWVVTAAAIAATTLPGTTPEASADDPAQAAVVWPVTATPHMTAAALGSGSNAKPVFDDDSLAGLFAPGGRLREVVDAGKGRDVSWVLDPDVVIAAQEMSTGYRVAKNADSASPQDTTEGTGQGAARAWLSALREAVKGREVWLLPYADTDLASLAHHPGTDTDDLTEVVSGLAADAKKRVDRILGTGTHAGLGWPADGALDSDVTALGAKLGVTRVLASGQGLTPTGADPVTVGSGDDAMTALPYEADLTTALGRIKDQAPAPTPSATQSPSPSPSPGDSTSSPSPSASASPDTADKDTVEHVAALLKANARPVLVPPRNLSGTAADALGSAIDAGTEDGWLDLQDLRAADDDPVEGRAGSPSAYPSRLRDSELGKDQLTDAAGDLDRLATLSKVLADPKDTTESVHAAMARALATAWRVEEDSAQRTFQERTTAFLSTSVTSLRLVPKTTVTVTSGDASIPVTVDNALQQEVSGLELRVTSSDSERLRVNDDEISVSAEGSASHTSQIDVTAKANGKAHLTAQLYTTSDGRPWGEEMTFEVDVTSVSSGAIAVVAAGVGLIVLAAVFRMRRVRRRNGNGNGQDESAHSD
ncbi:DUF6049 family protein [Streptomyces endophyticus]|uniref:DUF6049 family protein n=1 Tax=Streptomyces endophyticus TaxID=714166 RepID=A0ABU6FKS5_9ACTN|nr:DUF6049 family protein [Streptomyces endophyticus]MEB8344128.1 DUF6049 family protein [Streptomyces endophyticus]